MSGIEARIRELRADTSVHYNCAQSLVIAFGERAGLDAGQAGAISANFGSGMKAGMTCGAITGGLMALGLFGVEDSASVGEFYRRMREHHEGMTDCRDLLAKSAAAGIPRKTHCDGIVLESARIVEEMLQERGKLRD